MPKMRTLLAVTLTFVFCIPSLRAEEPNAGQATQASLEVLLDAIRSNRKALIATNLGLTDDEAAKFWPIYERYQKDINAVGDRQLAVIQDYTKNFRELSNEKATQLVEDWLAAEGDRVRIRREYIPQFAASLPGRKVARLYQIENKMDAVIRYDLAATIPVIEEEAAPR